MKIQVDIDRESHQGEKTKKKPTDFCILTESKRIDKTLGHYASDWFIFVENLGGFLVGLETYEKSSILFRTTDEIVFVTICDNDE